MRLEERGERRGRRTGVGQRRQQFDAGLPVDEDPDVEILQHHLGEGQPEVAPEVGGLLLVGGVHAEHRVVDLHRTPVRPALTAGP